MHHQVALDLLSQRKVALLHKIDARREDLVGQAAQVLRPLRWIDLAVAKWREVAPVAKLLAVPLGLLIKQKLLPKGGGVVGGLFRWAPVAMNFFRSMR